MTSHDSNNSVPVAREPTPSNPAKSSSHSSPKTSHWRAAQLTPAKKLGRLYSRSMGQSPPIHDPRSVAKSPTMNNPSFSTRANRQSSTASVEIITESLSRLSHSRSTSRSSTTTTRTDRSVSSKPSTPPSSYPTNRHPSSRHLELLQTQPNQPTRPPRPRRPTRTTHSPLHQPTLPALPTLLIYHPTKPACHSTEPNCHPAEPKPHPTEPSHHHPGPSYHPTQSQQELHHYTLCPHTFPPATRPLNVTLNTTTFEISGRCYECDLSDRRHLESIVLLNPVYIAELERITTALRLLEFIAGTTDEKPGDRGIAERLLVEGEALIDQRDKEIKEVWRDFERRWGPGTIAVREGDGRMDLQWIRPDKAKGKKTPEGNWI